jgi:5-methylcytosine-specific restriction endonuclease McrA
MSEHYSKHQTYYQRHRERLIEAAKERYRRRVESGEHQAYLERSKAQRAEYKRLKRAEAGATPRELVALRAAIKRAGRLPSVARLVYDQQLAHWTANPDDRAEFLRQYTQWRHRWRYAMEPSFRLYHRAKSKQRKARERGSRTVMLSGDQMWRRWVEFGHRCAYCGADGDLQVEHVMPISQGGEHHLGNIVPACQRCNYSKATTPVKEWHESQPFFSETRWLAILEALDRGQPDTEQLPLLEIDCGARGLGLGSCPSP